MCNIQCFITNNPQQGTWTTSHLLWRRGFNLHYFPAIGVGGPVARGPWPTQPKFMTLITPTSSKGALLSPAGIRTSPKARGVASTHAAAAAMQSWPEHTPPWPSRAGMGKHLYKVCPREASAGDGNFGFKIIELNVKNLRKAFLLRLPSQLLRRWINKLFFLNTT